MPRLLDLRERRGLQDPEPDKEPDAHEHEAEQERHPPAPRPGQHGRGREEDQVAEQEPRRDPHLRPAPEEAAPALGGVLDRHQDGPAPLAADPDALAEAQHDEQYRGQDADGFEGGQKPDQGRRDTHDEERRTSIALRPILSP